MFRVAGIDDLHEMAFDERKNVGLASNDNKHPQNRLRGKNNPFIAGAFDGPTETINLA